MVNIPVIARRELNSYFLSPIAYVVLTAFALGHGLLFSIYTGASTIDPTAVLRFAFWVGLYLMIVAAPIISMGLLSREVHDGTIEPLMTAPVSDGDVVLGKFCGALLFSMTLMIPILLETVFLGVTGTLDYGPVASGFLGLYLLTAQFLAVGLFCSTLTRVQIGSAITSFVILLGMFFLWLLVKDRSSGIARALRYLAPPRHFGNFVKGIVDTRSLVYFVTTTCLFLFLSVRVLESRKWR
jgi:ABC-2 type transport system permease protein